MLTMPNMIFPGQPQSNTKSSNNTNSSFQDLLSQHTGSLSDLEDISLNQEDGEGSQLEEIIAKLEDLLPSEVLDILKDNETLQQELLAFVMQSAFPMQDTSEKENGLSMEEVLGGNSEIESRQQNEVNPLEASKWTSLDSEADLQNAKEIYLKMADLIQSIETMDDIPEIASSLTKLLQEWNQAVQNSKSMDQQKALSYIKQQVMTADAPIAQKLAFELTNQFIGSNLSEEIVSRNADVENLQRLNAEMAVRLQAVGQMIGSENLDRLEAKITTWLQSVFKEVSPGVIKQNSDVAIVNKEGTGDSQPVKAETEGTQRIDSKLAAWVQSAFQEASPGVIKQETLPISKVEQYILNTGQADLNKALTGKELIDKIESIVQSQRMQNFVQGQKPISIQLRPENLGDMTIRFMQVNGEMTVQMLVSSKAVKDLLESNMHQLRNMFSPHQVTVEKQDNILLSNADAAKSSKENQNEQQQSNQQESASDSKEQEQASDTESFEAFMEKLLSQNMEELI